MEWTSIKSRIGLTRRTHTGHYVAPNFALEFESGFIAAARLNPSKKRIQTLGVRELPSSALSPNASKANVTDLPTIKRTISEVLERVGNAGGKVGLLVPDVAARVALLQFETLPENGQEAETLVLWRMREFLPYAPEEARLSYQVLSKQAGAMEVLAVAIRGTVLAEYEAAMSGANGAPALVLPASLALLPLLPEAEGGELLLHLCPGSLTAVVVAENRVRYWRTRPLDGDASRYLEEVAREATRVLATCQDNLHVQVQNVWFCSRPPAHDELRAALSQALGRGLLTLHTGVVPVGGLPAGQQETFDQYGMPFAGLMANV